jgi:hypothetical protein
MKNIPIERKCRHDWIRILTDDYSTVPVQHEGDYQCSFCNEMKTKKQLDDAGELYFD